MDRVLWQQVWELVNAGADSPAHAEEACRAVVRLMSGQPPPVGTAEV